MSIPHGDKSIIFIRHGTTEMNEYLATAPPYGRPGFVDPGLWDTRLSIAGRAQAVALNAAMRKQAAAAPVELIVASPLSRALDTASLVFEGIDGPARTVSPLIRERLWLSSDVGRPPEELAKEFAHRGWDLAGLDREWWYGGGAGDGDAAVRAGGRYLHPAEPEGLFRERLFEFKRWLQGRPEQRIAAVSHWGVIRSLTGRSLANCEAHEVLLSDLLAAPLLALPQ